MGTAVLPSPCPQGVWGVCRRGGVVHAWGGNGVGHQTHFGGILRLRTTAHNGQVPSAAGHCQKQCCGEGWMPVVTGTMAARAAPARGSLHQKGSVLAPPPVQPKANPCPLQTPVGLFRQGVCVCNALSMYEGHPLPGLVAYPKGVTTQQNHRRRTTTAQPHSPSPVRPPVLHFGLGRPLARIPLLPGPG